jgi:hypothetical protein
MANHNRHLQSTLPVAPPGSRMPCIRPVRLAFGEISDFIISKLAVWCWHQLLAAESNPGLPLLSSALIAAVAVPHRDRQSSDWGSDISLARILSLFSYRFRCRMVSRLLLSVIPKSSRHNPSGNSMIFGFRFEFE